MSGQYVHAVYGVMINKNQCNYNYIVIIVIPAKMHFRQMLHWIQGFTEKDRLNTSPTMESLLFQVYKMH